MYIFRGDVYCNACGDRIAQEKGSLGWKDTGDSNDFPQHAAPSEADSPQHCGECGEFLENPLTTDGDDYVVRAVVQDLIAGKKDSVAVNTWRDYYDYLEGDIADILYAEMVERAARPEGNAAGNGPAPARVAVNEALIAVANLHADIIKDIRDMDYKYDIHKRAADHAYYEALKELYRAAFINAMD